jgi:hypothetical protein
MKDKTQTTKGDDNMKTWNISEVGYVGFDTLYYLVSCEGKYPHRREYMKEHFKTREDAQRAIEKANA